MSDTESFESAMAFAQAVMSECDIPILDRLKRAHDHEIRDMLQQAYHRGFEAGRRSKDAEHEHVALRLGRLTFDGGSHENLSRIAYAVYPCATGWTPESCAGLRDRLIDLLGGVRNFTETAKTINLGGEHDGEPMESGENHKMATINDEPTLSDLWGVWKDGDGTCPNENGTCPNDGPLLSITDELRKYVAETWDGSMYVNQVPNNLLAIADRIDEQFDRICQQQEAVLQSTIDDMVEQRDGLLEELDELRGHSRTCPKPGDGVSLTDVLQATIERMADERDQLRAEVRELRAKLGIIREAVDG